MLAGADLRGARLLEVVLVAADLSTADLRGVELKYTEVTRAKAAGARGDAEVLALFAGRPAPGEGGEER